MIFVARFLVIVHLIKARTLKVSNCSYTSSPIQQFTTDIKNPLKFGIVAIHIVLNSSRLDR